MFCNRRGYVNKPEILIAPIAIGGLAVTASLSHHLNISLSAIVYCLLPTEY